MGKWLLVWVALVGLMLMGADGGPESIWPWNIVLGAGMFFGPLWFGVWWWSRKEIRGCFRGSLD
ncbi:MAG: hypothetical protein DRJ69_04710 [Thermoprotei archaeon]|nr:MAG: hypothetical protein DRJ69_04710 [Thermoprotei archaeon]